MPEELRELHPESRIDPELTLLETPATKQFVYVEQLKTSYPDTWRQMLVSKTFQESLSATLQSQQEQNEFTCPHVYRILPGSHVTFYIQKGDETIVGSQRDYNLFSHPGASRRVTSLSDFDSIINTSIAFNLRKTPELRKGKDESDELDLKLVEIHRRIAQSFSDYDTVEGVVVSQPSHYDESNIVLDIGGQTVSINPDSIMCFAVTDLTENPDQFDTHYVYVGKTVYVWDELTGQWVMGIVDAFQNHYKTQNITIKLESPMITDNDFENVLDIPRTIVDCDLQPSENGYDPSNISVSFEEPSWYPYADTNIRPNQIVQSVFGDVLILELHNDFSVYCLLESGDTRILKPELLFPRQVEQKKEKEHSLIPGSRIILSESGRTVFYRFIGTSLEDPSIAILRELHTDLGRRSIGQLNSDIKAFKTIPLTIAQQHLIGHPIDYISDPIVGPALQQSHKDGTIRAVVQWTEQQGNTEVIKTSSEGKKIDLKLLPLGIYVIDHTQVSFVPLENILQITF